MHSEERKKPSKSDWFDKKRYDFVGRSNCCMCSRKCLFHIKIFVCIKRYYGTTRIVVTVTNAVINATAKEAKAVKEKTEV